MAKGKKSSGKHYTSKGSVGVNKQISREVRKDFVESGQRTIEQIKAWRKGKRVMLTIPNPDRSATNKQHEEYLRQEHRRDVEEALNIIRGVE